MDYRKTIGFLQLFLIFSFFIVFPVRAQSDKFTVGLSSEYIFTATGSSTVNQNFSITNLTSQYLVSGYEILFPDQLPSDLSGFDSKGKLTFQTSKTANGNLVRVLFNDVAAGKSETLDFTLSFAGPKAFLRDNIWDISIPPLTDTSAINLYTLTISVPDSFGLLAYTSSPAVNPTPKLVGKNLLYTFTDPVVAAKGLSVVYGNFQTWGFKLNYQLSNPARQTKYYSLLLPPDGVGQKISFDSLTPAPENISVTQSGNWIALYPISSGGNLEVEVLGQIRLATGLSENSKIPPPSIISFSAPGITPSSEYIRPYHSEIFYDIYSASFPKISLDWQLPNQLFPFFSTSSYLQVSNSGNTAAYALPISISTSGFAAAPAVTTIPVIPPLSFYKIPVKINLDFQNVFSSNTLTVTSGNTSFNYNIPAHKLNFAYGFIILFVTLFIVTAAALTQHAGSLYLHKRLRHSHLRRQS